MHAEQQQQDTTGTRHLQRHEAGGTGSWELQPDAVEERWRDHRSRNLWMYFINIMLGLWLLTSPTIFNYQDEFLPWNDALVGVLVIALGVASLYPSGDFWGRWGLCLVGIWLWLAPLVFHAPTAYVYANDTLVGALLVTFSVIAPGVPGKAHFAVMMQPGPEIPPGWTYNPSGWGQRLPIAVLAFISFFMARYMAAYQLGHIDSVWDPFFDPGTQKVLTSNVSEAFPIPDSGLGAATYVMEGLSGFLGATNRWRTTPWMVILFGIMIIPLGVVSIGLIVMQPVVVGAWCTLCLGTGLVMLILIPLALDELLATLQFLRQAKREGKPFWRTLWVGGTIDCAQQDVQPSRFQMPPLTQLVTGLFPIKIPWTLLASALIGFWLMASPAVFDATGAAATNNHLVGPLIAVVAFTAFAEVGRAARFLNVALGLWLIAAPWLLGGATTGSTINDVIVGLVLIALSIPRGAVRDRYSGWQPYIV